MHTVLYVLWFLLPLFFFVMALWAKLEQMGKSVRKQNPGDFFKQGLFVLVCVLLAVTIDTYFLSDLVNTLAPDFMPLGFFQIILLPIILFLAAKWMGPTKDIMIDRNKNHNKPRRR